MSRPGGVSLPVAVTVAVAVADVDGAAFGRVTDGALLRRSLGADEDAVVVNDGTDLAVVDELRLDGGRVNALVVKELLDVFGDLKDS